MRRDPLGLLVRLAREYGPIARLPLGGEIAYLVSEPAYVEQILVTQHGLFQRGVRGGRVFGNGLGASEGEPWRRRRRLVQPAFHRSRVAAYSRTIADLTLQQVGAWREGERRDVALEMMHLALAVGARSLFGAGVEADEVAAVLAAWAEPTSRSPRSLLRMGDLTTGGHDDAVDRLDAIVRRIIAARRAGGSGADDLLAMLLGAVDEDGIVMTPEQVRDEVMSLLLVGHDTTACGMSWTWYLLSQHPEAEARLHDELDRVLRGRLPVAEDALPYAEAVIAEALRLYPPSWTLRRRSIEPFELGGYRFPAGTLVFMSQWVVHRDPRTFDVPEAFRPERWLDGLAQRLPPGAYFPFGTGPRLCVAHRLALAEAMLVLAIIGQRFRLRLVPGHPVVPYPATILRLRHGLRMTIGRRG